MIVEKRKNGAMKFLTLIKTIQIKYNKPMSSEMELCNKRGFSAVPYFTTDAFIRKAFHFRGSDLNYICALG